jgi:SOS response regulatory protein OraA/RecX
LAVLIELIFEDNSELLPKLDTEIDTINKIVRPMGIIEAIQEERIRQATEEVTEQVTQQVTQQVQRENIQKLYKRGFGVENIAEILEVPLEFVKEAIK